MGWALGPSKIHDPLLGFHDVVIKEAVVTDSKSRRYYPNNGTISNIQLDHQNLTSVSVTEGTLARGGSLEIVREVIPISLGVIY